MGISLSVRWNRYFHQVLQPSGSVFPTLRTSKKFFRKFCNSHRRSPPRQSDTVDNSYRTTGAHCTSLGSSPEPPEQRRSSTAHVDGDPHRLKATQPSHAVLQVTVEQQPTAAQSEPHTAPQSSRSHGTARRELFLRI
jgi:hypothetical protein